MENGTAYGPAALDRLEELLTTALPGALSAERLTALYLNLASAHHFGIWPDRSAVDPSLKPRITALATTASTLAQRDHHIDLARATGVSLPSAGSRST